MAGLTVLSTPTPSYGVSSGSWNDISSLLTGNPAAGSGGLIQFGTGFPSDPYHAMISATGEVKYGQKDPVLDLISTPGNTAEFPMAMNFLADLNTQSDDNGALSSMTAADFVPYIKRTDIGSIMSECSPTFVMLKEPTTVPFRPVTIRTERFDPNTTNILSVCAVNTQLMSLKSRTVYSPIRYAMEFSNHIGFNGVTQFVDSKNGGMLLSTNFNGHSEVINFWSGIQPPIRCGDRLFFVLRPMRLDQYPLVLNKNQIPKLPKADASEYIWQLVPSVSRIGSGNSDVPIGELVDRVPGVIGVSYYVGTMRDVILHPDNDRHRMSQSDIINKYLHSPIPQNHFEMKRDIGTISIHIGL